MVSCFTSRCIHPPPGLPRVPWGITGPDLGESKCLEIKLLYSSCMFILSMISSKFLLRLEGEKGLEVQE